MNIAILELPSQLLNSTELPSDSACTVYMPGLLADCRLGSGLVDTCLRRLSRPRPQGRLVARFAPFLRLLYWRDTVTMVKIASSTFIISQISFSAPSAFLDYVRSSAACELRIFVPDPYPYCKHAFRLLPRLRTLALTNILLRHGPHRSHALSLISPRCSHEELAPSLSVFLVACEGGDAFLDPG